ncbi:MAG: hypothetical protein ABI895_21160 [Deltaproteobacteria bacterium]
MMRTRLRALCCTALYCAALCSLGCGSEPPQGAASIGSARQALSLGSVLWEQKTIGAPPARMGHTLVYDAARAVTLAAGGRPAADTGASFSDTWAWDGRSWASVAAGLPARGFITGTYDSGRGVSLTYGGLDVPATARVYFSQVLERGAGAWILRSGFPGNRSGAGLSYDSARAVTTLFGGFDGIRWRNEIWQWNGTDWLERCNVAPCNQMRPSVRENAVFVYDPARQVTLLFGGFGDGAVRGETWTWDGSTWSQRLPPASPSPRHSCAAAYDPSTQRIFVFGGVRDDGETNELWAWDGTTWEQRTQTEGPAARRDARLAWDTARKRGVLFGGRSGSSEVDFWELSLTGNSCSTEDECHNDSCIEGICGGPPPEPEVDAGPLDGSGGASSAADSGGSAGASGSAGDETNPGGSAGNGDSNAGEPSLPWDPGPAAPPEDSPALAAARGAGATSFYSCSSAPAGEQPTGNWLFTLVLLSACRRRRSSAPRGPRALRRE